MTIFLPFVVLVPANLITNPVKALENFFVVFIQRYCNEADSLPSFCLQTFSEAFAQSVGIQRASEVCYISPSSLPYEVNRCLLLSWLLLRFVNDSFNAHTSDKSVFTRSMPIIVHPEVRVTNHWSTSEMVECAFVVRMARVYLHFTKSSIVNTPPIGFESNNDRLSFYGGEDDV
ncbi:hypothetical protein ACTXT7_013015 [Hymenolepis weldensis]